ncbi:hypothetical protein GCM10029964_071740 [Kibdelosporangium lantanae]
MNPNGIPDPVFDHIGPPDDVRDGLRGLYRFNLITHEDGLVRVHALLQRAVRETITTPAATEAADALLACWPEVDVQIGPIMRANSAALRQNGSSALWVNGMHPLLPRTVDSLGSAALLTEAIRLCRELCDEAADRLGPAHPDTLALRNKLGGLLGDAGSLQEAVACLEKLVTDMTAALGPDHPSTIDAHQNLGYQYGQSGELTKAVAEMTAAVADRLRTLGPDDPTVFNSRSQLAYWRGRAGDAAGAIAALTSLEPRAREVLGPDHVTTLDIQETWPAGWAKPPTPAQPPPTKHCSPTRPVCSARTTGTYRSTATTPPVGVGNQETCRARQRSSRKSSPNAYGCSAPPTATPSPPATTWQPCAEPPTSWQRW